MGEIVLRTRLCDLLEIEYPIMLAGMGGVARAELVAAVSNAGGLGVLGGMGISTDELREEIRQIKRLTNKPFGVDLILPANARPLDAGSGARTEFPAPQLEFVAKLKNDLRLREMTGEEKGSFRRNVNVGRDFVREQLKVIFEERVPVFASGLGNPGWIVPDAHAIGMRVIGVVGNVRNALEVAKAGVDVIVAQGHEAGGHTGRIGTLALVPQVVDAVSPTPVAAAGGIADGRGLAAAFALGACGVWVGTAFIPTLEAAARDMHKIRVLEMSEEDTRISRAYSGKSMRVLNNAWVEAWEKAPVPTLPMPLQRMLPAAAGVYLETEDGQDVDSMPTGQIGGMIQDIKPAGQVLEEMVAGAIKVLKDSIPADVLIKRGATRRQRIDNG